MLLAEAAQPGKANVLLEERSGAVVTLRLNRPDRLNALNFELGDALAKALAHLAHDASVRAVVITGTGRGFCAGGDLEFLRDARNRRAGHELEALLNAAKEICVSIATMEKPVLAAVNGPAAGGGANLALACDLRIASEEASFGQSFAKLGLFPDFGGTYFLPRLVGPAHALELFLTGEMIPAAEASRIGMVNRVVPAAKFEEETRRLAEQLAAAPPLAVRPLKRVLTFGDRKALEERLDDEARQQAHCFQSEDAAEGFAAFFEKRRPQFRGR
ncbi:MAG: enoyl-CoA hydratase [Candidatus Acidiferrales bacterium]